MAVPEVALSLGSKVPWSGLTWLDVGTKCLGLMIGGL